MADGDHVCLNCNSVVSEGDVKSAKVGLIASLTKYQTLLSECEELEPQIKPVSSFPDSEPAAFKKRSFIKYFWPYIIVAGVGFYITYVGSTLISISSAGNLAKSQVRPNAEAISNRLLTDTAVGFIIALIIALAVIIIGVKISKRKQSDFNKNAAMMYTQLQERYKKGLINQKMIKIYEENELAMRQYEPIVPEEYRTSASLGQIITLLKEDKAQTIDEAIALL